MQKLAGLKEVNELDYEQLQENEIDRLADTLEKYLDMPKLLKIAQGQ